MSSATVSADAVEDDARVSALVKVPGDQPCESLRRPPPRAHLVPCRLHKPDANLLVVSKGSFFAGSPVAPRTLTARPATEVAMVSPSIRFSAGSTLQAA